MRLFEQIWLYGRISKAEKAIKELMTGQEHYLKSLGLLRADVDRISTDVKAGLAASGAEKDAIFENVATELDKMVAKIDEADVTKSESASSGTPATDTAGSTGEPQP